MGLFTRLKSRDGLNGQKSETLQDQISANDTFARRGSEVSRIYTSSSSSPIIPNKSRRRSDSNRSSEARTQKILPISSGLAIAKDDSVEERYSTVSPLASPLQVGFTDYLNVRRPSLQSNHSISTVGSTNTSATGNTTNTMHSKQTSGSLIASSLFVNDNSSSSKHLQSSSWRLSPNIIQQKTQLQTNNSPLTFHSSSSSTFSTPFLTDDGFEEYSEEIVEDEINDANMENEERMFSSSRIFYNAHSNTRKHHVNNYSNHSSSTTLNGNFSLTDKVNDAEGKGTSSVISLKRASSRLRNGFSRRPSTADGSISRRNSLSNLFGSIGGGSIDRGKVEEGKTEQIFSFASKRRGSRNSIFSKPNFMKSSESLNSTISVGSRSTLTGSKMVLPLQQQQQQQQQQQSSNNVVHHQTKESMEYIEQQRQTEDKDESINLKSNQRTRPRTFSTSSTQSIKSAIKASILRPLSRHGMTNENHQHATGFDSAFSNVSDPMKSNKSSPKQSPKSVTLETESDNFDKHTKEQSQERGHLIPFTDLSNSKSSSFNTTPSEEMFKKVKMRKTYSSDQKTISLSPAPRRRLKSTSQTSSSSSASHSSNNGDHNEIMKASSQEPVPEIPKQFKSDFKKNILTTSNIDSPSSSSIVLSSSSANDAYTLFDEATSLSSSSCADSERRQSFSSSTHHNKGDAGMGKNRVTRHTPNTSISESVSSPTTSSFHHHYQQPQTQINGNLFIINSNSKKHSTTSFIPTTSTNPLYPGWIEDGESLLRRYENAMNAVSNEKEVEVMQSMNGTENGRRRSHFVPSFSSSNYNIKSVEKTNKPSSQILTPEEFRSSIRSKRRQSQPAFHSDNILKLNIQ